MAITIGMQSQQNSVESIILRSMRTNDTPWVRPNLYGSSAGKCQRENFLSAQEKPLGDILSTMTPASYLYMGIGDGIEKALVNGLTNADRLFGDNVYLPVSNPVVRGKMDIVFLDGDDNIALGEIKSCGNLPMAPKPDHLAQATTYASISGHNNVHVIYVSRSVVNKDGSVAIKAFKVDTSEAILRKNMQIIVESGTAIKSGFIPPIPEHMHKSACYFCQYKDSYCWGPNASDGRFQRLPADQVEANVIELNSLVEAMWAGRRERYLDHLESLGREDRVKSSEKLQAALRQEANKHA